MYLTARGMWHSALPTGSSWDVGALARTHLRDGGLEHIQVDAPSVSKQSQQKMPVSAIMSNSQFYERVEQLECTFATVDLSTSRWMRSSAILPSGLGTSSISVCSGISSLGMSCTPEGCHCLSLELWTSTQPGECAQPSKWATIKRPTTEDLSRTPHSHSLSFLTENKYCQGLCRAVAALNVGGQAVGVWACS